MTHSQEHRTNSALAAGGEMEARIRAHNWAATSVGPIEGWPPAFRTALDLILGSQMPMWIGWGPDILFLYNDAYVRVLGEAKHPWALGRPAAEVWAEIWDVCGPLAERVFRAGEAPFVEDVRLFMKRGERLDEVYYSFSYSPIRDESGAVAGLFCPNTEVTAKLLHARRLRTLSELATRALVENTTAAACASAAATLAKNPDDLPFVLLYLDAPGGLRLEQAVRLAPGIAAYSPQEVAAGAQAGHAWPLLEVLAEAMTRVVTVEASELLPRGLADQPVRQAVILPVTAAGHERPLGVMVAGVNPTRVLDTEYSTFYELVAGQVATAIQNATAVEEEKRRADALAELDRAKTTFFSNISHEFRTPLTLMLGPTEDALASPERALRGEALGTVHRNELRLLRLVNGLLDFSRLEAGRMVASYEPVDLAALTADVASSFRAAIERAGLRLEVEAAPISGPVAVDRDMWEKIVLNLLSNALKFTLEGTIRVGLRAHGEQVELTVADTGIGIPREEMARVFERFHRVDDRRARTHEGTGIGLALVQELTRLHGGEVTVDSEVGRGTRFTVTIPRARAPRSAAVAQVEPPSRTRSVYVEEAERSATATRSTSAAGAAPAGYVLVADDNADMRDYLQRVLAEGWRVTAVADGMEAVEAARRELPDLVLTDVMMPGLDGFQVLATLRSDERTRAIPVIMLSARAGEESRVDGLDAGADDYLVKPFSRRELLARVRAHVALARLRRQSERDLAELYALLMQVPAAITVCRGPELRCVFQNAAAIALRDARGKTLREAWCDVSETCLDACVEAARTGAVQVRREVAVTGAWADGPARRRFWDVTCAPLRLTDGGEDGVVTIAFEVTDRVQVRREAEAGEERRRIASEAAGCGTWRIDLRTRLDTRDAQLNRMLGLPDVETTLPLDDFLQRAHPEDRPRIEAAMDDAIRRRVPYVSEARYVRPDGSIRWLRDVGRVIVDDDGEAVALTGAAVDITARKAAEAAQAAAQERLRAALEASAIGTYVWNIRTDAVEIDEGVRHLFGMAADEGVSLPEYTARIHEADRPHWLAGLIRSAEEGADFCEEYRVVQPDGAVRWVIDKGRASLDARGRPTHMAGAVVDITEQKRLAEVSLDASRAKDEFLAMLGHELRNPLAPIVTALQVMKLRDAAPPRELQVIERQVQHLTRLVDDLLDISRVTRGLIDLKPERVALREVISKALEIASPLMEQKGHYVSVTVPRELTVRADPVRLAQVFANLLTNAARYTQSGGRIAVSAAVEGGHVVARVVDDGCGISGELLGRIFDLFIQGKRASRDRAEGGLGIGLSLVRTLVQMHGGEVSAASEGPGRGSEFIVRLPAVAAEAQAPIEVRKSGPVPSPSRSRRVLLVDDNVDAAELLSEALREFGYTVAIAHDGPQALALVTEFRPEVAVLDIGLPVMDGYELARRLRQRGFDDCRMIALTGYGQEQDHARSRDAGFSAHMIKPVDVRKLAAVLTEA